ncbi:MAG: hypothetical protein ACJ770_05840, partial [Gemmatimonadaceae bacterium]
TVQQVTFYHGADELYVLTGLPGVWHEQCLIPESAILREELSADDHASRAPQQSHVDGSTLQPLDEERPRNHVPELRRDLLIVVTAAGLFALLAGGVFAARVLERDLAGLHGPVGLLALAPALVLYAVGALFLLSLWKKNRRTMRNAVAITALAPIVVLVVLTLRACWVIATPAG